MNKRKATVTATSIFGLVILALFIFEPFKVIDPSDPRFNPDRFRFKDYYNSKEISLYEVYEKLFPPGTPKEFVDRVLVRAGRAQNGKIETRNGYLLWSYRHPPNSMKGGPHDVFLFDGNQNVLNISIAGNGEIYKNMPTRADTIYKK